MFENVLVGVDGRNGGRDGIALAKQLAAPDARITLAHICGAGRVRRPAAALLLAGEFEQSQEWLERARGEAPSDAEIVTYPGGSVGGALHDLAEQYEADLVVVGACHRGSIGRALLGDNARTVLNDAPCAVAIAPCGYADTPATLATVGVGYDGSPESGQALAAARELAARHRLTIKGLTAVSTQSIPYGEPIGQNWPEAAKRLIDRERRRVHGLEDIEGDATYGKPSTALTACGDELDILVVGSRSHGPLGRWLHGSTSNHLARHARCPLLVIPRSAMST